MKPSSNNNDSLIDEKKVIPEHEDKDYKSLPSDYSDWRQVNGRELEAVPDNKENKNFEVLPESHPKAGDSSGPPDKKIQKQRIIIPIFVLVIVLLSILAIWLVLGDTIMNLIQ
ncbi:MAG: hypothetical protein GX777_03265 [Fastidiosipila sp.]|nr:hypothetical protein [Fastidiosipila sp.]